MPSRSTSPRTSRGDEPCMRLRGGRDAGLVLPVEGHDGFTVEGRGFGLRRREGRVLGAEGRCGADTGGSPSEEELPPTGTGATGLGGPAAGHQLPMSMSSPTYSSFAPV